MSFINDHHMLSLRFCVEPSNAHNARPRDPVISRPISSSSAESSSTNSLESSLQDHAISSNSLDIDKMIQTNLMQYDHRLIGGGVIGGGGVVGGVIGGGGGLSLNVSEFRSELMRSEPSVSNSNNNTNHHPQQHPHPHQQQQHHHQQMYVEPLQLEKLGIDSSFNNDRYLRQRSSFIGTSLADHQPHHHPHQQQRGVGEGGGVGGDNSLALDILGDTSQLNYLFHNHLNIVNPHEKSEGEDQQQQSYSVDQSRMRTTSPAVGSARPLTSTSSPTVGSARPDSRSNNEIDMSLNLSGNTMPITSSSFDSHYHFNLARRTTDDDDMFDKAYSGNFMESDAYCTPTSGPPVEFSFLSLSPKEEVSSVTDEEIRVGSGDVDNNNNHNKMMMIVGNPTISSPMMDTPGKAKSSSSRLILPSVMSGVTGSSPLSPRENSKMLLFANGRKSMDTAAAAVVASVAASVAASVVASSPTGVNGSRTISDESGSNNSILDHLNNEIMLELSNHSPPSGRKKKFIKPILLKSSSCPVNSKIHPVNWDVPSSPQQQIRQEQSTISNDDSHESL